MPIKIKSKKNLVEFIPKKCQENLEVRYLEDGLVQIIILRNTIMDKFVRTFIKKTPETFIVNLDEYGSFVYNQIDGKKDIYEIGIVCKEHFGEDIEPLYERLGAFFNLLKNNKFITFVEK